MISILSRSHHVIEPLDIHKHWEDIEKLMLLEGWPFTLTDLELSESQERFIGLVARIHQQIVGVFTVHHFGDVAYLDTWIIHPDQRKNVVLANDMWRAVKEAMNKQGFDGFVVHCSRTAARFMRVLGYRPGLEFGMLRREADLSRSAMEMPCLGKEALAALIALDAQVFGASREVWLRSMAAQPATRFVGRYNEGRLVASCCLRERRENALCIDNCNALSFEQLEPLLLQVLDAWPHKRLECFALRGSDLERFLAARGFYVPAFFADIGPLTEYRSPQIGPLGLGPAIRTLAWF